MNSNRRYLFYGICVTILAISLFFQSKANIHADYNLYIRPAVLVSVSVVLLLLFKMKDLMMKILVIFSLIFFAGSLYFFESEGQHKQYFMGATICAVVFYIILLIAGRRRNFKSMELSTMRRHPWISAILMGAGFFLFKDIEVSLSGKKLLLIVLIAVSILAALVVIERNNQVHPRSFIFMLLGLLAAMAVHAIQLHYLFHRTPDLVPYVMTILTGFSGIFLAIGAACYEDQLVGDLEGK